MQGWEGAPGPGAPGYIPGLLLPAGELSQQEFLAPRSASRQPSPHTHRETPAGHGGRWWPCPARQMPPGLFLPGGTCELVLLPHPHQSNFLSSQQTSPWGKGFRNGWRTVLQPLLVKAAAKRWVREVQRDRAGPGLSRLEPEAAMSTRWPPAQGAAQPRGSGSSEKRREGPGPSLVLTRPGHWDSGSVREHLPHARRRPLPPPGVLPGFSPPEDLDQSCC